MAASNCLGASTSALAPAWTIVPLPKGSGALNLRQQSLVVPKHTLVTGTTYTISFTVTQVSPRPTPRIVRIQNLS